MSENPACQDDFIAKRREELIEGKPVTMSPRFAGNHNRVLHGAYTLYPDWQLA